MQSAGAISFIVPGRLKGKGRARSAIRKSKSGKQFVQVYADKDTANAEAMIRSLAAEAMAGRPPLEGPLFLSMLIIQNTPVSWSKKRRATTKWITGKPDADNQIKVMDALNGIAWRDDSQICKVSFERRYDDSRGECAEISVSRPPVPDTVAVLKPSRTQAYQAELDGAPLFGSTVDA